MRRSEDLNRLALRVTGKHYDDLSGEELHELKRHPDWLSVAYGNGSTQDAERMDRIRETAQCS